MRSLAFREVLPRASSSVSLLSHFLIANLIVRKRNRLTLKKLTFNYRVKANANFARRFIHRTVRANLTIATSRSLVQMTFIRVDVVRFHLFGI